MADPPRKTYTLADGILYGPVRSRRMGVSLGINILPPGIKLCSFNCPYCQCGGSGGKVDEASLSRHRFPSARDVAEALRARLRELRDAGVRPDSITFSGNGEPTLHPDFEGVVRAVRAVRDEEMPGARVDILSNASNLGRPGVVEGLNLLDDRHMKLDAGSDAKLREMNLPIAPLTVEEVARGLFRLRDFVLQAMFSRGRCDNTDAKSVAEWIEIVRKLRPKAVHLYSIDRVPADSAVLGVDRARLEEIAREVTARTGIPAEAF